MLGPSRGISAGHLEGRDAAGKAVLLNTGWDVHFGTPAYGDPAPFLAADGVEWLVANGAVLVGIDSVNVEALPDSGARFFAAPPAVEGFGTFPVRAFALLDA